VIYPARGTLKNYVTGNTVFGRAIWNKMYKNANDLGAITLLMLGLTLAIATVKTQSAHVRRAATALVPVTLLIILLTQSRGTFLGLLVGFGPPLLARLRKRSSGTAPVLAVLAVIAVLVPAASWHRLESISKGTSVESNAEAHKHGPLPAREDRFVQIASASARERFEILKTGLDIAASHPLLGVGIGCYRQANARYAPQLGERDAHNTYVSLAAETGLPGLLLWLGLVGSVLAQVRRRRAQLQADDRTIQVLWIHRAIIGYLVAGIFASYAGLTISYLFLGILWAASNVLGRDAPAPGVPPARRALRAR
jgi:O-antigen ligase